MLDKKETDYRNFVKSRLNDFKLQSYGEDVDTVIGRVKKRIKKIVKKARLLKNPA